MVKIVQNIRRDQQEGILFPMKRDAQGNLLFDLKLLSTGGTRQFDTDKIVNRYDLRITQSILADFIMLGHETVGSFALSSDKTDLFAVALGAWLKSIAGVLNMHALPRLFRYNGLPTDRLPEIEADDIEQTDLGVLGAFLQAATAAGMPLFPDENLENWIRSKAGLPEKSEEAEDTPQSEQVAAGPTVAPPAGEEPDDGAETPQAASASLGDLRIFHPGHGSQKSHGQRAGSGGAGGAGKDGADVHATGVRLSKTSERAFSGAPVAVTTKMSKQAAGALGEAVVIQHLQDSGMRDARPLNAELPNFAVDLVQDHTAIEVKTGLVSNGKSAQQWRMTIGEPGKQEKAWLSSASADEKAAWNARKGEMIHERKQAAMDKISKDIGKPVTGKTITTIINPDTQTIDLFEFDGFHSRIGWNSAEAQSGYTGSYQYEQS
jgi:hypothetical protein